MGNSELDWSAESWTGLLMQLNELRVGSAGLPFECLGGLGRCRAQDSKRCFRSRMHLVHIYMSKYLLQRTQYVVHK